MKILKDTTLIGVTGPAHCGKDTVAELILKYSGKNFVTNSFAKPMKDMLKAGLGLSDKQLYGDLKDTVDNMYGCTPRHMMQTLGTQWGRYCIDNDIWVNAVKHKWLNDHQAPLIMTDVRFENEAAFIREYGQLIHIYGRGGIEGEHESEKGVKPEEDDLYINNRVSLKNLETHIKFMLE
jgi:hypothetical protein